MSKRGFSEVKGTALARPFLQKYGSQRTCPGILTKLSRGHRHLKCFSRPCRAVRVRTRTHLQVLENSFRPGGLFFQHWWSLERFHSVALCPGPGAVCTGTHCAAVILETENPYNQIYSGDEIKYSVSALLCCSVLAVSIADIVADHVQTVLLILSSVVASYIAWQIPTSVSSLLFVGLLIPAISNGRV